MVGLYNMSSRRLKTRWSLEGVNSCRVTLLQAHSIFHIDSSKGTLKITSVWKTKTTHPFRIYLKSIRANIFRKGTFMQVLYTIAYFCTT